MLVVGLDLASTTGVAAVKDGVPVKWCAVSRPADYPNGRPDGAPKRAAIADRGPYPWSYLHTARSHSFEIVQAALHCGGIGIDVFAIEETNVTKGSRYAQKYLEFLHAAVLERLTSVGPVKYVSTTAWRSALGVLMPKDAKKANLRLRQAQEKWLLDHPAERKIPRGELDAIKRALGVAGKVSMKHVAVAYVRQKWGIDLKKTEDDIADAICVAASASVDGVVFCNGR